MPAKYRLSAEEREFFSLVQNAVLANPFSDERMEQDLKIVGMFPDVALNELIDKAIAEVRNRMDKIETQGRCDLQKFSPKDQQMLRAACLFDIFYSFVNQFDQLIQEQITAGDKSIKVPFANDALAMFHRRGFNHEEALHFFAMCYQFRRAYYFIDHGLVGRSQCMKKLRERLWNNVFTYDLDLYDRFLWNRMEDFSTLILGETGTGKGAAAMAIGRSGFIAFDEKKNSFAESFNRTFVSLNLSQFSENLIESELFGHRKGAFTGAIDDHDGIFDRCTKFGAIFLDEIGEVSIPVQIKLLKVLEERIYSPVGSHIEKAFNGRIIAATNRSIDEIQSKKLMRDDFFYRLCSDMIIVPPLRQRIEEDAGELDDLLAYTIMRITGQSAPDLTSIVRKTIEKELGLSYSWPGNVRELGQCVRRILLNRSYKNIAHSATPAYPSQLVKDIDNGTIDARTLVQEYCRLLYDKTGNYGEVARRTGLDRRTVKKHVEESDAA
mgnify:CR=1 FL=1